MSSPEVEKFEISDRDWDDAINIGKPRRISKNKSIYGVWADSDSDDGGRKASFKGSSSKGQSYLTPMSFVSGGIKQGDKILNDDGEEQVSTSDSAHYLQTVGSTKRVKRTDGVFHNKDKEFGKWEVHTKGIGQKLLTKMGFEHGKGLGVRGQGITAPVEATKRRNSKASIAFYGPEKKVSIPDLDEVDDVKAGHIQQWRKHGETKKKASYLYKSAQDVIESSGSRKIVREHESDSNKVKIIDMTGREQRVLHGYKSLSKRHDCPDENEMEPEEVDEKPIFEVPELIHNLNLLVDMAEEDIIANDRKIHHGQDRLVNIEFEKERLNQLCEYETKQIDRLQYIVDIVESCEERLKPHHPNRLTLPEVADIFSKLQGECYEEYKLYELSFLSVPIVFPLMREYFLSWHPLVNPTYGLDTVRQWRYLLEDPSRQFQQDHSTSDPYQRLIWDIWMPFFRSDILNCDIRKCDPIISLLEHWMPLLPAWIMENIISQLIMPRLVQEVDRWNPVTDTMPIHLWLQPWLPLIGERLDPLYAPIRHKLAHALTNWHPSDSSAKLILQPWVGVFKPGQMEAFVTKNILPKLSVCLHEFPINPHNQLLDPWNWVMSWGDLIPADGFVTMLEKCFFPRWHQVLISWLTSQPNYEEVRNWYLGWKSMIPEKLMTTSVKDQLTKALDAMNQAISGKLPTKISETASYIRNMDTPEKREITVTPKSSSGTSYSFKELVQRKAEDNSLLFMPMLGKTYEAKQVYRFGCKQVYIDRNVLFMYDNNKWIPISLQHLIDSAR